MGRRILLVLAVLMTVSVLAQAQAVADLPVIVTVHPSQDGDAVVRWVDLASQDGTWFLEYHVEACYIPGVMEWDTLAVIDGRKAFWFVHRGAWREGLHYRVTAHRQN